jgi:SPP1 family predicted phage head-tail adaptor
MRIGEMRERVTIQSISRVEDDYGEWTETVVAGDTVSARILPLRGSERLRAAQMQTEARWRLTMRYRTDVTASTTLLWGSKTLEVTEPPVDPDGRRRWLEMNVSELRPNG